MNKMENKKYHTINTFQISSRKKYLKGGKISTTNMTAHFNRLEKWRVLTQFYGPQISHLCYKKIYSHGSCWKKTTESLDGVI